MNIKQLILLSSLSLTLSCETETEKQHNLMNKKRITYEERLKEIQNKYEENLKSDPNYYDRYKPKKKQPTRKRTIEEIRADRGLAVNQRTNEEVDRYNAWWDEQRSKIKYQYASPCCSKSKSDVSVRGYYRSNGTYVKPHMRTAPNGTKRDNFSYKGNTNPYHKKN